MSRTIKLIMKIEKLRDILHDLIIKKGDLLHSKIIKVSQDLDILLNKYNKIINVN